VTANWKRWAIGASLAFNAATLTGLLYGAYVTPHPAPGRGDLGLASVWRQMGMTPEQKTQFQKSNADVTREMAEARVRLHREWLSGITLLDAPVIDWDRVRAQQQRIAAASSHQSEVMYSVWTDRARMLNPEQRAKLFTPVEEQIRSGEFFKWQPGPNKSKATVQGGSK
jgi:Spy/CpxP family protein refolding chaperone